MYVVRSFDNEYLFMFTEILSYLKIILNNIF